MMSLLAPARIPAFGPAPAQPPLTAETALPVIERALAPDATAGVFRLAECAPD